MRIKEKKSYLYWVQTLNKSCHRTTLRILSCKFGYQLIHSYAPFITLIAHTRTQSTKKFMYTFIVLETVTLDF